jgi:hypothetical protein
MKYSTLNNFVSNNYNVLVNIKIDIDLNIFDYLSVFQFSNRLEDNLPKYNTRVKLPTTQKDDMFNEGEC